MTTPEPEMRLVPVEPTEKMVRFGTASISFSTKEHPMTVGEWSGTITIPLTKGMVAVIDAADRSLVERWAWHAQPRRDGKGFYAVNSSGLRMHRMLLGVYDRRIVDHIDGDGLNNRRGNLRAGTQAQNCVNRKATPGPHLRGARPKKGLWQAYIKQAGKQISLGYFETEKEAHEAYLAEAGRRHGDWMPLPTPPASGREGEAG